MLALGCSVLSVLLNSEYCVWAWRPHVSSRNAETPARNGGADLLQSVVPSRRLEGGSAEGTRSGFKPGSARHSL